MVQILRFMLFFFSVVLLEAGVIRFAPLSMEKSDTVVQQYKPMLDYLEQRTGHRFVIVYSSNYADMLHKIEAGEIDVAYLGPLPYVALRKRYPHIEPLVRFLNQEGEASYTCSIVARDDSGLTSLKNLSGKTIALTQPLSTCGYLMSESLLQKEGSTLQNGMGYSYTGSHVNSMLSVILGESDVGGAKTNIAKKYTHFGLKILATTPDLPGFLLIANTKTLAPEVRNMLRETLLVLQPLKRTADRALTASWGTQLRYGAVPARPGDYDLIEKALGEIKIPGGIEF